MLKNHMLIVEEIGGAALPVMVKKMSKQNGILMSLKCAFLFC